MILLATAALGMGLYLIVHGRDLVTPDACLGIVSLELPVTADRAAAVIASWDGGLREIARKDIYLDFLFLLLYPLAFSAALAAVSAWRSTGWTAAYRGMSWQALWMIPLDAFENLLMLRMLAEGPTAVSAAATTLFAATKFLLFFTALTLLLRALLRALVLKLLGGKLGET